VTTVDSTADGSYEANAFYGERAGDAGSSAPGRRGTRELRAVWRAVSSLPGTVQRGMKTHPTAVLAGVGTTTFVVGVLCGSRVGRLLTTTLVGYGVRRLIEGPVAREVARYATQVMRNADGNGS
jgi:hypothetical protein